MSHILGKNDASSKGVLRGVEMGSFRKTLYWAGRSFTPGKSSKCGELAIWSPQEPVYRVKSKNADFEMLWILLINIHLAEHHCWDWSLPGSCQTCSPVLGLGDFPVCSSTC